VPRDNARRVVEGARKISPALGERMIARNPDWIVIFNIVIQVFCKQCALASINTLNESFHRKIQRVTMVLFYYSQRFYTPWTNRRHWGQRSIISESGHSRILGKHTAPSTKSIQPDPIVL
jgi:hypothetical protein